VTTIPDASAAPPGRSLPAAGPSAGARGPSVGAAPRRGGLDLREIGGLALLLALLWLSWHTWLVYPLKVLVVLFHELSHGLAAIATGGEIVGITVVAREGGLCRTLGGNRFLTLSAGYLGSLAWGGLLLVAAARSRRDQAITAGLGVVLLAAALLWVRPLLSFGFAFSVLAGAGLLAAGLYLPAGANDFLLKAMGLTSIFYAVFDIQDDVLRRPHLLESDAAVLAALTGLPTLFWGLLWMAIALAAAVGFLALAGRVYTPRAAPRP
jgi:hypothetical protein